MIEAKNILYTYPKSSFRLKVSEFTAEAGQRTAIIGPSGSGKTTWLNLIAGILLPSSGQVRVNGQPINHLGDSQRRDFRIGNIGFVFQDFRLVEYLDVMDNILLPFRINNNLKLTDRVRIRALDLLQSLDIKDKSGRYPAQLSHGERQRVAIGRALVNDPDIILADEPTGNLDPVNKDHIMEILYDYAIRRKACLLVVTHDHNLLLGFDHILDFATFQVAGNEG